MRRAAPTANFPAAGGRRPAGETRCVALTDSVCCRAQGRFFSFIERNFTKKVAPLENKGGEAVKYTKVVHFSELSLLDSSEAVWFVSKHAFVRRSADNRGRIR